MINPAIPFPATGLIYYLHFAVVGTIARPSLAQKSQAMQ